MHTRMFAALAIAAMIGATAVTPALAQNATPTSASSSMLHDSMHHDAMQKGTMHAHPSMMKKDSMRHDKMMMKHDGAMKMKKADSAPASSGG